MSNSSTDAALDPRLSEEVSAPRSLLEAGLAVGSDPYDGLYPTDDEILRLIKRAKATARACAPIMLFVDLGFSGDQDAFIHQAIRLGVSHVACRLPDVTTHRTDIYNFVRRVSHVSNRPVFLTPQTALPSPVTWNPLIARLLEAELIRGVVLNEIQHETAAFQESYGGDDFLIILRSERLRPAPRHPECHGLIIPTGNRNCRMLKKFFLHKKTHTPRIT